MNNEQRSGEDEDIIIERLDVQSLNIPELKIFKSSPRLDTRGHVSPSYNKLFFQELGIDFDIIHENHCVSPKQGTMRGFHYQLPPYGQAKFIQVLHGRILDVNLDLRQSSPTFGTHVAVELSSDNWNHIFIPVGFAHCYCTLAPETEVMFKLGAPFAPRYARGLAWDDPDLAITWPITSEQVTILERDLHRPRFSELTDFYP
ncbi:MAG: dTDP-4-dehydrorhamnose 3,5-epimerase family protein [Nitrospirales bacterium]|nr:dTDP-4-dehydrorhamnose 3,5-epimerase family protein [Nitrospira sp.]MDR4502099.1 dTDP-4-dehydrorhamnose 3,5-epimerase family protein [Nitrospirales bacterium]